MAQRPPALSRHGSSNVEERTTPRERSRSRGRSAQEWSHIKLSQKFAYRSLDKVEGTVEHASFAEAERVKCHLVGTCYITETRFRDGTYREVEREWEFLRLTKRYELEAGDAVTKFWFRLPETLLETVCPLQNPFHLLLPPTVGCEREDGLDDMSPKHPTPAQIEYVIQAELYKGRDLLKRYRQPFRVAPRHFTTPGTSNPPPEYNSVVHVEQEVTRAVGGKIGRFEITLRQPPALLTSLESHQQTSRVPITLEFHSTTTKPPKIVAVNLKLLAITSARSEHILEGTRDQARRAVECRLNRCEFSKANAPSWMPSRPGVYTTEMVLPVTICGDGYVAVPEFESCLVDRTYRLALKFELVPVTGLPLNACRLKFPVWIMADEFYGIPSETAAGVPIKMRKRYALPDDYQRDEEGPAGSLPKYEDTLAALTERVDMVGLGSIPSARFPSTLDGTPQEHNVVSARYREPPSMQAPFRYRGQEPDYWESQHHRLAVGGQAAPGPGNAWRIYESDHRAGSSRPVQAVVVPQTVEGVEPVVTDADDPNRVPEWLRKERERDAANDTPEASRPASPENQN